MTTRDPHLSSWHTAVCDWRTESFFNADWLFTRGGGT